MQLNEIQVVNALPDFCKTDCHYFAPITKAGYGNDAMAEIKRIEVRCYNEKSCRDMAASKHGER